MSELKYVQFCKYNDKHSALGRASLVVHFGSPSPDLSVYLMLPQELMDSFNIEDGVDNALQI